MYENNVAVSTKAAFAHLITSTSTLKYVLNVQRNSIYEKKKKSGNNPKAHHQEDSYTVYTLPTEYYMQSPPPPTAESKPGDTLLGRTRLGRLHTQYHFHLSFAL